MKIEIRHYFGDNPHFDGNTTVVLKERIEQHITKSDNGCWTYAGAYAHHRPVKGGDEIRQKYVTFRGENVNVRRFLIESYLEGALDDNLRLKMVCGNAFCVRPEHAGYYEMTDHPAIFHPQSPQDFCDKGHALTGENAAPREGGRVRCKTCRKEYDRQHYLANRDRKLAYNLAKRAERIAVGVA